MILYKCRTPTPPSTLQGEASVTARKDPSPYSIHRKGILPSAVTTSRLSLRDGEEVSLTVEEGREGRQMAGLDGGRVPRSLHALEGGLPTPSHSSDVSTRPILSAYAPELTAVGLGRFSDLSKTYLEEKVYQHGPSFHLQEGVRHQSG